MKDLTQTAAILGIWDHTMGTFWHGLYNALYPRPDQSRKPDQWTADHFALKSLKEGAGQRGKQPETPQHSLVFLKTPLGSPRCLGYRKPTKFGDGEPGIEVPGRRRPSRRQASADPGVQVKLPGPPKVPTKRLAQIKSMGSMTPLRDPK